VTAQYGKPNQNLSLDAIRWHLLEFDSAYGNIGAYLSLFSAYTRSDDNARVFVDDASYKLTKYNFTSSIVTQGDEFYVIIHIIIIIFNLNQISFTAMLISFNSIYYFYAGHQRRARSANVGGCVCQLAG
jgi:hypothetical protein